MERQLDTFYVDRRWRQLWLWLAVPLLALFGLLGYNSWALHQAHNEIHDLTQAVKTLRQEKTTPSVSMAKTPVTEQSEAQTPILKSDTVYYHVVIRRYDTIFQTVVRHEISDITTSQQDISTLFNDKKNVQTGFNTVSNTVIKAQVNESKSVTNNVLTLNSAAKMAISENISMPINSRMKDVPKTVLDSTIKADLTEKATIHDDFNTLISGFNKVTISKKMDSTATPRPLSIKTEKVTKTDEKVDMTLKNPVEKQKMRRLPIIKPLKIVGYEIGVSSGLAIINGKNIIRQDGFSIGGRGGILLGKRLKVVGEMQYVALSYELNKITGKQDIPIIAPPSPNDEFTEVRIQQPYLHYALGMQYVLTHTRVKPYIGLSVFGQTKSEEQFEYLFKNKVTGEDVFVKTKRNEATFQLPFLRFNVGAEYSLGSKFKTQLEGSYDVKLQNSLQFQPLYQVKGIILYRF